MSVVALGCMHACGDMTDQGGENEIVPLPCAGRLDLTTMLWPFALGRDGLVVLSCDPRECRHRRCEEGADDCMASGAEQVSVARELIGHAGLSPKRAAHRVVSSTDDPTKLVWTYRDDVERLGGWVRTTLPPAQDPSEDFVGDRCARLFAHVQALRGWRERERSFVTHGQGQDGDLLWLGCHDVRAAAAGDSNRGTPALELWRRAGNSTDAVVRWRCCGQPLLEIGEDDAFSTLARANASMIVASGAKRLITACTHCAESFVASYADAGIELGVEVVDLWQWARETFEITDSSEPMAIVASREASQSHRALATAMAANVPSLREVVVPHGGEGTASLQGASLTSRVTEIVGESTRQGAKTLVTTSPHDARRWRAVMSPGRWQTGPSLEIEDVSEALLELIGAEFMETGAQRDDEKGESQRGQE